MINDIRQKIIIIIINQGYGIDLLFITLNLMSHLRHQGMGIGFSVFSRVFELAIPTLER